MARTGKIARLPGHIRLRLNQRLDENETSEKLLQWLNGLPETEDVLYDYFDNQPITEVNLTAWRQGGYQDWLEDRRSRELVERLADQAHGAEEAADGQLSERLAVLLTMRLAGLMQKLLAESDNNPPEKQWQYAKELSRELDRVRRSDHRSRQLHVQEQQWEWERDRQDRQDEAQADKDERKKMADAVQAAAMMPAQALLYGKMLRNSKLGDHVAKTLFEIKHGHQMPENDQPWKTGNANPEPAGKGEAQPGKQDGKAPAPAVPSKVGGPARKAKKAPPKKKTKTRSGKREASGKADSKKSGVALKQKDTADHAAGAKAKATESETDSWDESIPSTELEGGTGGTGDAASPEPGAEPPDPEGSL